MAVPGRVVSVPVGLKDTGENSRALPEPLPAQLRIPSARRKASQTKRDAVSGDGSCCIRLKNEGSQLELVLRK